MTKQIDLTRGEVALVDDTDFERLSLHRWHATSEGYAARRDQSQGGKLIYMHREVLGTPDGAKTDHINGNRLDNRRGNLRQASQSENLRYRGRPRNNKSGYKGVSWHSAARKWEACIAIGRRKKYLGVFNTREEAAAAYDQAAREHYGEFAWTNDRKG